MKLPAIVALLALAGACAAHPARARNVSTARLGDQIVEAAAARRCRAAIRMLEAVAAHDPPFHAELVRNDDVHACVFGEPPASPTTHESPRTELVRYGKRVAVPDLIAASVVFAGLYAGEPEVVLGGFGLYLVGGPLVHAARGRGGTAARSLFLRAGLAAVGLGAGLALASRPDSCQSDCEPELEAIVLGSLGVLVSMPVAMVLDWTGLARERRVAPIAPTLSVGSGGATIGISASF